MTNYQIVYIIKTQITYSGKYNTEVIICILPNLNLHTFSDIFEILPLSVQILTVILAALLIFSCIIIKYKLKLRKYKYKEKKLAEKEKTKRADILSNAFVKTIQSNDRTKQTRYLTYSDKIIPFDKLENSKSELTENFENNIIQQLTHELTENTDTETSPPVHKMKKSRHMKISKKHKNVT